jgi:DNA-binding transcriptional MocR family regulator
MYAAQLQNYMTVLYARRIDSAGRCEVLLRMNTVMTKAHRPIYLKLADELSELLETGQLKAGDRLPSVRRLVVQKGVSATTAVAALRDLEHRGFAVAKPQSGYFAKPCRVDVDEPVTTRPPPAPHTVGIDSIMVQLIDASQNPRIASLGTAIPDADLFPMHRLQKVLSALARRNPRLLGEYSPHYYGVESLRRELLRRYADLGCGVAPDEIVVTNGCTEALNLALRCVTRPGDSVALESPVFYGVLQVLQHLGLKALEIPTHPRDGLRIEALETALKGRAGRKVKACLVSANFSNPTGACLSDTDKERLVHLCAHRGVTLIEDDIYGDLQHLGSRPLPAKTFDTSGNVILCSSFSKTLAPGARIGWLCGGRFSKALRLGKFASSGPTAAILQELVAELLRSGGYERHLAKLRNTYARQVVQTAAAVSRYFPRGTRMTQPRGGFVIWVELPKRLDSLSLFEAAIRQGVNFAPGPLFSATGRYRNFLRLNCGRRMTPELDAALGRLGRLAIRACT